MDASLTELVLDRAHNAVVWMDEDGLVTYWNPSAARLFGIARDEALGRAVADLIIPERFRAAHVAGLERFLRDGIGPVLDQRIELAALRADGGEFPVEMTLSALKGDSGWVFTAFIQDLTERTDTERERDRLVVELRESLQGSERRFDAIIGSLSDPVTIRNREKGIVYANAAALAHLGLSSIDELHATTSEEIWSEYLVLGEDGRELTLDAIPSVRILAGETPEPLLLRTINRASGEERWNLLKASPLAGDAGAVEATITVIEDVTERKRAERDAAFLARASEVLASSLDYERTLRNVAELAVPDIADWCAVDLFENGERRPVAIAHVDPAQIARARELRNYEPGPLNPDQGLGLVLRTGEPVVYPDIPDELLSRSAVDEHHLELLRSVGMRSVVIVPMRIGTDTLGAMTLVSAESRRVLTPADVAMAEQIAARAAVAIENARLYSERSRIAHTLQQSLVPEQLPEIPGFELAGAYVPAVAGTEVGGDFYDAWEVQGGWMVVIGDVTGKGVEAAALTAVVRYTMRALSEFVTGPAELLARVDGGLKKRGLSPGCTALCLRIVGNRVTIAAGGHPLPLCASADGVHTLGEHGPLLGALDDVEWTEHTVTLEPGATLVLYTDGVTDAVGESGRRYGTDRLVEFVGGVRGHDAADVAAQLVDDLSVFQAGAHADDVAILVLRNVAAAARPANPADATAGTTTGSRR